MISDRRPSQGFILVVTLWITLALSVTAVYFGHSTLMDQHRAANIVSARQADMAIEGVVTYVRTVLELSDAGVVPDPEETLLCDHVAIGEARAWLIGRDPTADDDTSLHFALVDEASRINLNTATVDMLLPLPGMTAEIAAAIVDWRDEDDDLTEQGAETETYSRADRPYSAKNAPFATPEELRLVHGVDAGLLFGKDTNLNGMLEDHEDAPRFSLLRLTSVPAHDQGWLDYVTVWSREPTTREDGSQRVNVNDTSPDALTQLLRETLDAATAQRVIAATQPGTRRYTSLLQFFTASGLTPEQFALVDHALTTTDDPQQTGLVNVNTASAIVLACLPGIDESTAERLLAYRRANDEQLGSIAWVTQVLDPEQAQQVGPYLTTNSYQFSADVAAVGAGGRGYRRILFVFDTIGEEVRVLYRRDRTGLGWALADTLDRNPDE